MQSWIPHPYQKRAVKFLVQRAAAALFMSPGLGKTSVVYAAIKVLKGRGMFKGALVIPPLRPAYSVWPAEAEKWADFKGLKVCVLHGDKKDEVLKEQHDIYIMNFDGIEWLFGTKKPNKTKRDPDATKVQWERQLKAYTEVLNKWKVEDVKCKARRTLLFSKVDILVIDELSKMKHTDTKRFKSLKPYLHKFARRWGLTGSPAANGLMDLFGECFVLDMGKALGQYITHYRSKYFYPTGFGGYTYELLPGADDKIYKAVKPLALTMEAEDYITMPKLIPVNIYVDLPPAARKVYDKMEEDLFAELDGNEFMAFSAASANVKCQQIANGAIYKDVADPDTGLPKAGKREWVEIHKAKLEALDELLGELQGQPSLWGYHFAHDLQRIVKMLGKDTPHFDVSAKEADKLIKRWNKNELPWIFGHPASMSFGLNLQSGDACHLGFFNIPYDREQYDQFIDRIRRQGNNTKNVFVYHIIARNTVDIAKMAALAKKGRGQSALLEALKSYRMSKK